MYLVWIGSTATWTLVSASILVSPFLLTLAKSQQLCVSYYSFVFLGSTGVAGGQAWKPI